MKSNQTKLTTPIETPRLLLREFEEDDWPAVLKFANPEANPYVNDPTASTEEEARQWIHDAIDNQTRVPRMHYIFAVVRKDNQEVVGYQDIVVRDPHEHKLAYAGYGFAVKHWNKGYGTESHRAMLDYGFRKLDLFRISLICDPDNIGSWRIMEKSGLRREGHEIQAYWDEKRQKLCDRFWYALLQEEWIQKGNSNHE